MGKNEKATLITNMPVPRNTETMIFFMNLTGFFSVFDLKMDCWEAVYMPWLLKCEKIKTIHVRLNGIN